MSGDAVGARENLSERTVRAGREALRGERRGLRGFLPFAGPAIIVSIAYIDPGNFATNIQAGSKFGYLLLWVVALANLIAMLFLALSARLGIVTGKSLAEQCPDEFPRPVVIAMWAGSEIAAMATDLGELLGAAIGLSILFGLPLVVTVLLSGLATFAMLTLQGGGFRPIEILIAGFVGIISACYLIELVIAPPDWRAVGFHSVVPMLAGPDSVTLAVAIIGATVMPHTLYLHSSLTQNRMPTRTADETRRVISYSRREVWLALGLASLVNMAMVAMAARVFHDTGHADVAAIETAYRTLIPLLGGGAAAIFMVSLFASGFSSSIVGTMAGQVIMQDFLHIRLPLWLRRGLTMAPALIVAAVGVSATDALIMSQVVLSLTLPIPMVALLLLTSRRSIMGEFLSGWRLRGLAIAAALIVVALNAALLLQTFGVDLS